ncbi:MAG: Lrp/AsnC family transcriptional regulator [Hyphomicrobiaceae bacterium]|nr:MAG: Lrp/AsnC family transcriptional regulator [Hyphomicrobiaceae bacterium]
MRLTANEARLIDRWQRGFPLVPRPYDEIGRDIGLSEKDVIEMLRRLKAGGVLSRIGATLRPNTVGASTLAAIEVPQRRLQEVAALVSSEPCVTHNYEREHAVNLWFVVTAANRRTVDLVLDRIRGASGLDVLDLPLVRAYFVDLGFALCGPTAGRVVEHRRAAAAPRIWDADRLLLRAIEDGLPLVPEPYWRIALELGVGQHAVMRRLRRLLRSGVINRLGLIVRHHELGFTANAMALWDVPDSEVDAIGERIAAHTAVTLCYRRRRASPAWPYNLYCMVHGCEHTTVRQQIATIAEGAGIAALPHAVLFSKRRFKQRGATLAAA